VAIGEDLLLGQKQRNDQLAGKRSHKIILVRDRIQAHAALRRRLLEAILRAYEEKRN
jgi:hypothetical protein